MLALVIQKKHIQYKAAFMLLIFSLNMFIGFACAVGVDMGFNKHHHDEEKAVSIHTHVNSKKHHHEDAEHKHKDSDKKDDCCNDKVLKIFQTDKAVPQFAKILSPIFNTDFVPVYYSIIVSYPSQVSTSNKYFVRGHHPPIHDIRIAIQSFQI